LGHPVREGLRAFPAMIEIRKIELPFDGIDGLQAEAKAEGYDFIDTLVNDWTSAANRFSAPGEMLLGCFEEATLIAVGGLNVDPFAGQPRMGRIRRVYVRREWRNKGIGAAMMTSLIEQASEYFSCVRLRAESPDAARLYERLGFVAIENPDATHILDF
jgi:GNAT superfamily N-acetyltransferase